MSNYIHTPAQYPDELPVVMFDQPEQPTPPANLAARANERIRRLEAGRANIRAISDKPALHIRALDWLGNLPHRFGRWVDRTNAGRLLCLSVGGIAACVLVAFVVVPK